jgi:hypothetical protein
MAYNLLRIDEATNEILWGPSVWLSVEVNEAVWFGLFSACGSAGFEI